MYLETEQLSRYKYVEDKETRSCRCTCYYGRNRVSLSLNGLLSVQAAEAPYSQFRDDDIAHGWSNTCPWTISRDGTLTLWEGSPTVKTGTALDKRNLDDVADAEKANWDQIPTITQDCYWGYGTKEVAHEWGTWRKQVKSVVVKDEVHLTSGVSLFAGLTNMETVSLPDNMEDLVSMAGMFDGCQSLRSVDLSGKKVPNCTNLDYMFRNCLSLEWVYINDLDTSKVQRMRYMFQRCEKLVNIDLSNFDTSSLNNMGGIFYGCSSMASLDLRNFHLAQGVLDIDSYGTAHIDAGAFAYCDAIRRISLGDNTLSGEYQYAGFATQPPTYTPYTGNWVKEDDESIVLTTQQFAQNYPNDIAPKGTYVWEIAKDASIIEFDANGGDTDKEDVVQTGVSSPITLSAGNTYRAGHYITGWNTERDGSGQNFALDEEYTPPLGKKVILYAQWKAYDADLIIDVSSNTDGFGSALVSWATYDYRNKNFKVYQSPDEGKTWKSVGIDYRDVKEVKCLQIYPNDHAKGQLKEWIEDNGYGKDIIKIDEVDITSFNDNPLKYLKDENSLYRYDVIFFGTWDMNGEKDLSSAGADAVLDFIRSGRGAIFGHDTIADSRKPNFWQCATTAGIYNPVVVPGPDGTWVRNATIYSGNADTPYNVPVMGDISKVKISRKGLFTNYPWEIGEVGDVLSVPACHTSQSAQGDIWLRFTDDTYTEDDMSTDGNFYLTTHDNTAMIQTGHSKGAATDDEQKILANLIFYLNQLLFEKTSLRDASAQDFTAPIIHKHMFDNNKMISFDAEDFGDTYSYYVESYSKDDTTKDGLLDTSNIAKATVITNIAEYRYLFNTSPDTVLSKDTPNTSSIITEKETSPQISYEGHLGEYIHIIAIDGAGNTSATYTVKLPEQYKVVFKDGFTGEVIDEQLVEEGSFAEEPELPEHGDYYRFTDFSVPLGPIDKDTEITAVWELAAFDLNIRYLNTKSGGVVPKNISYTITDTANGDTLRNDTAYLGQDLVKMCPIEFLGSGQCSIRSARPDGFLHVEDKTFSRSQIVERDGDKPPYLLVEVSLNQQLSRPYHESVADNGFTFAYPASKIPQ